MLEKEPISKLFDEVGLRPTVFYRWQKELFENGAAAFEHWHKSLKGECIRPRTPLSLEDAGRLVTGYVEHYNDVRLNSAIGYITPKDMLSGRQQEIHAE